MWQLRRGLLNNLACIETGTGGAAPTSGAWNSADETNANYVISNNDLTASTGGGAGSDGGVRALTSHASGSGKWYFELACGAFSNAVGSQLIGITTLARSLATLGASTSSSFSITAASDIFYNAGFIDTISPIANNTACWAIDMVNLRAWVRRNAGNWNNNASNDPATNVGGINIASIFTANAAYPFYCATDNVTSTVTANFLGTTTAFAFTMPSGFSAWG